MNITAEIKHTLLMNGTSSITSVIRECHRKALKCNVSLSRDEISEALTNLIESGDLELLDNNTLKLLRAS